MFLDASLGALNNPINRRVRFRAVSNTDESPAAAGEGFNKGASNAVRAVFSFKEPLPGETYGIRLSDGHRDPDYDDIISLYVSRVNGVLSINFHRSEEGDIFHFLGWEALNVPEGAKSIVLMLTHEVPNSGVLNAYFGFEDAAGKLIDQMHKLPWTSPIFRGESKSRFEVLGHTFARSIEGHYYNTIFNRDPDAGGRDFWRGEALRLTRAGVDVAEAYMAMGNAFFASREFRESLLPNDAFVERLYRTFFDREADAGGRDFWVSRLIAGTPREMVMLGFMFSQEFSQFMQTNAGSFESRPELYTVVDFYRGLLSRLPDDAGLRYWIAEFQSAQCAVSENVKGEVYDRAIRIADLFFGSDEYVLRNRDNLGFVVDLYNAFMRRSASAEEISFWTARLMSGEMSRYELRRAFIDSSEFSARVADIVSAGCIQALAPDKPPHFEVVAKQANIWEFVTDERVPAYERRGHWYPGSVVFFFPQAPTVGDFWADGRPDILVPLNKGFGSGIDTRVRPLLFKNEGAGFREASKELIGGMRSIAGLRRVESFSDELSGISGYFGVAPDSGDNRAADALMILAGGVPSNNTGALSPLPLSGVTGRPHAVNANSLAAGDIDGNGLSDFIVGDWQGDGPYRLMQTSPGQWVVEHDAFLRTLAFEQPLVRSSGEKFNLLLDLHLTDINGDGHVDLIAGWGHGSTHSYAYLNDGKGIYSHDRRIRLPQAVYGVDNSLHLRTFSHDFDNDGWLDLLIIHSRFEPFYAGYALQWMRNEGNGRLADKGSYAFHPLPERDRTYGEHSGDNFYLIDVDGDGFTDIVGSDSDGVRLWLNIGGEFFAEMEVSIPDEMRGGVFMFVPMESGSIGGIVFRQSWTDAEGTRNRIWFDEIELKRLN